MSETPRDRTRLPLAERVANAVERINHDLTVTKGPYLTIARSDVTALRNLLTELHGEVTR